LIIPILWTNGYLFSYEPAIVAIHDNKGEISKYSGGYFIEEDLDKGFLKLEKMLDSDA
jgi:hypothetical protein